MLQRVFFFTMKSFFTNGSFQNYIKNVFFDIDNTFKTFSVLRLN